MEDNKIVFIIPLYNEENTISEVIVNCKKFGDVFAINDCSSDKSLELLKKLNIRYINNATNLGYEKSLFFGLEYVYKNFNYEYFISIDGDGQFDLTSIEQAVKQINKNKLFFSSIRKKKNRFIEKLIDKSFKFLFDVYDPLSGLKIYSRKVLEMSNNNELQGLLGMNYILFCLINNIKIHQFDIDVKPRDGKSSFGGFLKSNFYISISLFKFFYKYILFKIKYGSKRDI